MHPQSPRSRIQPKISTLPRQRSEATNYLDIYKLVIEKKRLQKELETLTQRQQQIQQHLDIINRQVAALKEAAETLALQETEAKVAAPGDRVLEQPRAGQPSEQQYQTEFLDY